MMLSPHFELSEFTRTKAPFTNSPDPEAVCRLRALCSAVLEPIREIVGRVDVTSGFRSPEVNDWLREQGYSASTTSQHLLGEAADIQAPEVGIEKLWEIVVELTRSRLPIDQAIVYQRKLGAGWVHISHTASRGPRRELLINPGLSKRYLPIATWEGPLVYF
jgi:zinc D-Ala-D-Ala carboxypeptidase